MPLITCGGGGAGESVAGYLMIEAVVFRPSPLRPFGL
jgi:hypothetical protein